ncbi:MAG: translocation/assembly module TamB domain-containing protein [Candidatus Sulfotelmatobacter sp.]|jgi:translocation and assembly module TamB
MRRGKIIGGALAGIFILIVAAGVGAYFFLQSESLQKLAIRTIVTDTNEATGGRAEIGKVDFQLSTLTAHLYNITLHGSEPPSQPPLLHIDKLTVGLKIQSIFRREISLSQLLIEHPVAFVEVEHNGKSNLPHFPQRQGGSNTSVFDLAARHALLTGGQVHYNDKSIPLDADLYGLTTEIHFVPIETRYEGSISYKSGTLRHAGEPALPHGLDARFSATPTGFSLQSALLKAGSSALSLNAELTNYANPTLDGNYDLRVHTQDFSAISRPVTPAGDVSLSGTVHYRGEENEQLLRSVSIDGQMASTQLATSSFNGQLDLRGLQGRYQLRNGTFRARDVAFETLGGKVSADIEVSHLDTTVVGRLRTTLRGISLQAVQQAAFTAEAKRLSLIGGVDGTVDASWTGSLNDILVRADLILASDSTRTTQPPPQAIPVDGTIHATYDAQTNVIAFRDTSLRIPSTTISAQGEVSKHSTLRVQAAASDLHELAGIVSAWNGKRSAPLEIAGSASLQALVQGSLQEPQLTAQFSAQNLKVQGSEWSTAKFGVRASSSQIAVRDAVLESAHQGKAVLNANLALQEWSYHPSSPATASLSVQRMAIVDLRRLANLHYPVAGSLSGEVNFHGSQINPAGSGSVRVENARAYDESIQHLGITFHAARNSITSTLDISLPAGSANGTISYTPQTKAYMVRLNAPSLVLQKLQLVQAKNLGVSGTLTISASGAGTLDNPQLTAAVQVPELRLRDKSISQIKGQLQVANQRAQLTLDSQVAQASFHSRATVSLSADYHTEASIDTSAVPLEPLLALYLPHAPQGFQGETELHATLKGPLKDKSRLEAHVTIPTLKASYQSLEIGLASPLRADYSNSAITLQPTEIRGTATSMRVQGTIPLDGTTASNLTAQGIVDVRVLRIMDPDLRSSGTLSFGIRASGTTKEPAVQGEVHIRDVALSSATAPLGVQKLNGTLAVNDRSLQFSSVNGEVGGGQVSLGGSISYRPNLQFSVSLQSKSVRLRYPDGVRALLDGNLALSGTKDASTLNGRVLIDSLSFTPDFDLTKFSGQFSGNVVPSQPGFADNVKLAVSVQSKSDLSATSSQVSLAGQVNLQVVGTAANPVIIGRTDLTSGELFYRNVRYQLQRGIISFNNPNETEPVLNISATTTVEQYNLTITLRGPFDKLTTSYTSDPPLATTDIINLIANGQTTQEASASGQTTDSMIASQVASQVTGGIQHLAGISSLQIDPLLGGNNQNPSARVAIQQRVTKNFLFTFSTDLSQPGSEIVQGDYQINQHWSVGVTRDEVGGVAVNGKYHTKF